MSGIIDGFNSFAVGQFVQCWGCGIFDRMFISVSSAAASVYSEMVPWAMFVLGAFWIFYIFWIVALNLQGKSEKDWNYTEALRPVLINTIAVCALLGLGLALPRFASRLTFEPVADITNAYAELVLQTDSETVDDKVRYEALPMPDDGFFRSELRDKIIRLMRTSTTQFQSMIRLGLSVAENAFTSGALVGGAVGAAAGIIVGNPAAGAVIGTMAGSGGLGNLFKHILMFAMGVFLAFQFLRLFVKYCFYFIDVVVNLAMFAFFFPFMMVFFVFAHAPSAAEWVKKMGSAFSGRAKAVFESIVALAVAVVTYTIIMVLVAKFFASDGFSSNVIAQHVIDGTIGPQHLGDENLTNLTLMGCIVIGFLVNYLADKIPEVGRQIFGAFGLSAAAAANGEAVGNMVEGGVKNIVGGVAGKIAAASAPSGGAP
ncbi:MAG: hypothetical protein LBB08_02550 [Rickettsiales bacterium]|nr:hypothetical protein [Rickettsiales bacterium]